MAENFLESILDKLGSIPGVRVNRTEYLQNEFAKKHRKEMSDILRRGPVAAGISKEEISKIADQAIQAEAGKTTIISLGTGAIGGAAALAAVPADITQFYIHVFRIIQKLLYLYGWEEEIFDSAGNIDDATKNILILYLGVMSGVGAAGKVVAEITKAAAKRVIREVPVRFFKMYITKQTFRTVVNKIVKAVGVKSAAKFAVASGSKVVPLIGGVVSGVITAAFFIPMSKRLKKCLAEGVLEEIDDAEADDAEDEEAE